MISVLLADDDPAARQGLRTIIDSGPDTSRSSRRGTACPPGVPVVLPGEMITAQTVAFLSLVAASPSGRVLGAAAADATMLRVVDE